MIELSNVNCCCKRELKKSIKDKIWYVSKMEQKFNMIDHHKWCWMTYVNMFWCVYRCNYNCNSCIRHYVLGTNSEKFQSSVDKVAFYIFVVGHWVFCYICWNRLLVCLGQKYPNIISYILCLKLKLMENKLHFMSYFMLSCANPYCPESKPLIIKVRHIPDASNMIKWWL